MIDKDNFLRTAWSRASILGRISIVCAFIVIATVLVIIGIGISKAPVSVLGPIAVMIVLITGVIGVIILVHAFLEREKIESKVIDENRLINRMIERAFRR